MVFYAYCRRSPSKERPKDHKARPREMPSAAHIVEAHLSIGTFHGDSMGKPWETNHIHT